LEGDLKDYLKFYKKREFDTVTCNPPYMRSGAAITNDKSTKTLARHEVMCGLEDVVAAAADLLDLNGRFFMVHRPQRLAEILSCMRKYKIEPKRLRFVHPDVGSEPILILVEGLIFGKEDIRIMPPLILKDENGGESEELKKIYSRDGVEF